MATRREFLKLVGLAAASAAIFNRLNIVREPYVSEGELVDYIGRRPGGFLGSRGAVKVLPWDGHGYPVELSSQTPWRPETHVYYDADLCCMTREVPYRFWHDPDNRRYPNVHTWVRCRRYGESIDQAVAHMNLHLSKSWGKSA